MVDAVPFFPNQVGIFVLLTVFIVLSTTMTLERYAIPRFAIAAAIAMAIIWHGSSFAILTAILFALIAACSICSRNEHVTLESPNANRQTSKP